MSNSRLLSLSFFLSLSLYHLPHYDSTLTERGPGREDVALAELEELFDERGELRFVEKKREENKVREREPHRFR